MADLLNVQSNEFPIGFMLDAVGPPNSNWLKCDGSILSQSNYPDYVAAPDVELHPKIWGTNSWEYITVDANNTNYIRAISNIGDYIVIIGAGNWVWHSDDGGETWSTNTNLPSSGTWYCLANNGSRFVAVQFASSIAAYSDNYGATWTQVNLPTSANWRWMTYDGSAFLVFHYDDTGNYLYSTSGTSFTSYSIPYSGEEVYTLGSSGSYTVILTADQASGAYDGLYFYTTSDGINWSSRSDKFEGQLYDVSQSWPDVIRYLDGKWFGLYSYTGCHRYWINEDANPITQENWIPHYYPPAFIEGGSFGPLDMIHTGEHFIMFNSSGNGILISKDGYNWQNFPIDIGGQTAACHNTDDWVVFFTYYNERRGIYRSTGTPYDRSTHFQLPHFSGQPISGMYKYIRVA